VARRETEIRETGIRETGIRETGIRESELREGAFREIELTESERLPHELLKNNIYYWLLWSLRKVTHGESNMYGKWHLEKLKLVKQDLVKVNREIDLREGECLSHSHITQKIIFTSMSSNIRTILILVVIYTTFWLL